MNLIEPQKEYLSILFLNPGIKIKLQSRKPWLGTTKKSRMLILLLKLEHLLVLRDGRKIIQKEVGINLTTS